MHVIWHEDVADKPQVEACSYFAQNPYSHIFVFDGSEEFAALVARERNEVKIPAASDALEIVGHKQEEPHPRKHREGRPLTVALVNVCVTFYSGILPVGMRNAAKSKGCATRLTASKK